MDWTFLEKKEKRKSHQGMLLFKGPLSEDEISQFWK